MHRIWLALLIFIPAFAQTNPTFGRFTFGVSGGVPISVDTGFLKPKRYTLGPSAEFALTDHISINFSPLYKRFGNDDYFPLTNIPLILANIDKTQFPTIMLSDSIHTRLNSWEFPVMGKYYFASRTSAFRPFLATGYSFEKSWSKTDSSGIILTTATGAQTPTRSSSSFTYPTNTGATFSAGTLWQKQKMSISPEFRYTYWGESGSRNQNQLDFLLNIRF